MDYLIVAMIELLAPVYNIDPVVAKAVVKVESNYNPNAQGAVGEVGLFQIRPEYSRLTEEQLTHPILNIHEGLRKLSKAKRLCKHTEEKTFVVCYNAGITGGSRIKHPKLFPYYKKVMSEIKKGSSI